MKNQYVEQIRDRDEVAAVFLLRDLTLAVAKNGKPYLVLRLIDRSGEIEGRVWDNADHLAQTIDKDDFVFVQGRASVYLGKMQVVVKQLRHCPESEVDLADFLPICPTGRAELEERLRQRVANLGTPHFRALMESFLNRVDFLDDFCTAPAAKTMHHVYLGGLLEHSLAVADLADDICGRYDGLNRDLLIVGALLHDVGKVRELQYRRSFEYTDAGKLLGHIMLGLQLLDEQLTTLPDFPAEEAVQLKHLLLSHHGQYEYGSPKRPKTLEAVILSYVDDLDSKINGIRTHFAREAHSSSTWSSYHRLYDRYFFKGGEASVRETTEPAQPLAPSEPADREQARHAARDRSRPLSASLADRLKDIRIDASSNRENGEDS